MDCRSSFVVLLLVAVAVAAPSLNASPAILESSPATVTLTWDGLDEGQKYVIGLYLDIPGLQHLGEMDISGPKGTVHMPVLNYRADLIFRVCTDKCTTSSRVATANTVTFKDKNEPLYGHLALTNNEGEMSLMFVTAGQLSPPQVKMGTSPTALATTFEGVSNAPFTADDLCFSPANDPGIFWSPGYQNHVILKGLEAGKVYYYSYGAGSSWSAVKSFTAPPAVTSKSHISAIMYADMGVTVPYNHVTGSSYYPAVHNVGWMSKAVSGELPILSGSPPPSLAVHIGDISYGRGYPVSWEWFMAAMEPLATQIPLMVGNGNHEYDYKGKGMPWAPDWANYGLDSGGECGVVYSARFTMPAPPASFAPPPTGRKNGKNLWYSFDHGPVHFVMMSTEHDFLEGSPQRNFIAADLAAVDRARTPWVVFMGHRPMYTSVGGETQGAGANITLRMRYSLEPLFNQYKVDAAFWGHVHQYDRSCPITSNGTCAAQGEHGTVHAVVGNAGNNFQVAWASSPNNPHNFPPPKWLVFRTFQFGISFISANATHFMFEARDYVEGTVHDSYTLRK